MHLRPRLNGNGKSSKICICAAAVILCECENLSPGAKRGVLWAKRE
jgi:hypothetical protein